MPAFADIRPATAGGALLLSLAGLAAAQPPATECPPAPFALNAAPPKANNWASHAEIQKQFSANRPTPVEIERIRDGIVSYHKGSGGEGEGTEFWYAYDAARHVFVSVVGHSGRRLERVPAKSRLGPNQFVRYTDAAGRARSEFVTVIGGDAAQARRFACLANTLLATPVGIVARPLPSDTAVKTLFIRRGGKDNPTEGGDVRWKLQDALYERMDEVLSPVLSKSYGN